MQETQEHDQEQELEKRIQDVYSKYGAPSTHQAKRQEGAPEYDPTARSQEMHTSKIEPIIIGAEHTDFSANCAYSISPVSEEAWLFDKHLGDILGSIRSTFNAGNPSEDSNVRSVNLIKPILAVELKCGLRLPVAMPGYAQQAVRDHVNSYNCSVKDTDFIFDCPALASGAALHIAMQDIKAVVIVCASSMRSYKRLKKSKETVQKLFGAPQEFEALKDQL